MYIPLGLETQLITSVDLICIPQIPQTSLEEPPVPSSSLFTVFPSEMGFNCYLGFLLISILEEWKL